MNVRKLALMVCLAPAAWATAGSDAVSLAEYRRQLHELATRIESLEGHPQEAAAVAAAIPEQVAVTAGPRLITVSYRDLKGSLAEFAKADSHRRSGQFALIREYLRALRAESDAFAQETEPAEARPKLERILAQREFRHAAGVSPGAILMHQIVTWLKRILGGPQTRIGLSFYIFEVVVYLLVGAALGLLLLWIVRRLRHSREEPPGREIVPFAPSARGWRRWLAEAHTSAQQQDWRGAIHLAYWAAISSLEERGTWRPNRARTPREYLGLLGPRAAHYPALAAITSKFELVWYGHRDALESDFNETLGQLEKLGCR